MNTDTTKRYRLLINLPDGATIGDTYKKVGDRYFNESLDAIKSPVVEHNSYFTWQVENCPTYFEEVLPVSEPVKERMYQLKYTQSEVDTIRSETWKAARQWLNGRVEPNLFPAYPTECKYVSIESYLSSLNPITNDTGKEFIAPTSLAQHPQCKQSPLSEIKEGEDKPVLFTTEDGIGMTYGMDYWWVDTLSQFDYYIPHKAKVSPNSSGNYNESIKKFSTKEAAEQYILLNLF